MSVKLMVDVPCSAKECGPCSGLCDGEQYFRTDKCEEAESLAAAYVELKEAVSGYQNAGPAGDLWDVICSALAKIEALEAK